MIHELLESNQFILLVALLLIISIVVTKFSTKLGVPTLVLFIAVGMIIGSDGLGFVSFSNPSIAQTIGAFALVVILFEGGLQTRWATIRPVLFPAVSLATIGVLLTALIFGAAAKFIFEFTWLEAFLVGSLVGSTDAAAVFSVLKGKNIRNKIEATLEAESGTNDPMAVFLTLSFIQLINQGDASIFILISNFFWQMGIGAVAGLLIGKLGSEAINRINLDSGGLYPLFALSFAFLAYSISSLMNASGFLAVYVAAIVIGNLELTYRQSILRFNDGFAWMAQILMFIILGLFVFPSSLFSVWLITKGLLLSAVLILIARPLATHLSLVWFKYSWKEQAFIAWAGLRGAVPIILAIIPMLAEMENSQLFFNAVFFVVLTSALVQGSAVPVVAKKFSLIGPPQSNLLETMELFAIGKSNVDIVEYNVIGSDYVNGKKILEMDLPEKALITAIVRKGDLITPSGETTIHERDTLYIMVNRKYKQELKHTIKGEEKDG